MSTNEAPDFRALLARVDSTKRKPLVTRAEASLAQYADSDEDMDDESYRLLAQCGPLLLKLASVSPDVRHQAMGEMRALAKRYATHVRKELGR